MWWKIVLVILGAPVLLYVALASIYGRTGLLEKAFGPIERAPVDFLTLELKASPNQYLVCPPELCVAKAHAPSPVFEASFEELRAAWLRVVERQPRLTLLSANSNEEQYEYQVLTPIIHFPDAVTVRLLPANEGRSTIAIYSRSHYGYGDLGVNRGRVQAWLGELAQELQAAP